MATISRPDAWLTKLLHTSKMSVFRGMPSSASTHIVAASSLLILPLAATPYIYQAPYEGQHKVTHHNEQQYWYSKMIMPFWFLNSNTRNACMIFNLSHANYIRCLSTRCLNVSCPSIHYSITWYTYSSIQNATKRTARRLTHTGGKLSFHTDTLVKSKPLSPPGVLWREPVLIIVDGIPDARTTSSSLSASFFSLLFIIACKPPLFLYTDSCTLIKIS